MYYTISQISNHAIELFALAGLNGEVLLRNTSDAPPGPRLGGMDGTLMGNEWLEEHMTTGYEGEWFTKNRDNDEDAAIKDNTTSRFMNCQDPAAPPRPATTVTTAPTASVVGHLLCHCARACVAHLFRACVRGLTFLLYRGLPMNSFFAVYPGTGTIEMPFFPPFPPLL